MEAQGHAGFWRARREMLYVLGRTLFLALAKAVFRLRVVGKARVPATGPLILAANHVSYLDPIVVAIAFPRPVHFMAKAELFRSRPVGWLLRGVQVFPVNRGRGDREAFRASLEILRRGGVLLVFPEGTRGDGSALGDPKRGIAVLAERAGAPVIPMYVGGTERLLPRGGWRPRYARLRVAMGAPIPPPVATDGRAGQQGFAAQVMAAIAALRAEAQSGTGGAPGMVPAR